MSASFGIPRSFALAKTDGARALVDDWMEQLLITRFCLMLTLTAGVLIGVSGPAGASDLTTAPLTATGQPGRTDHGAASVCSFPQQPAVVQYPTGAHDDVTLAATVTVSAGWAHSLAVRTDGTVWARGYNGVGQLGDGTNTDRDRPVRVSGQTNDVAASPQLGDGATKNRRRPVQVSDLTNVAAVIPRESLVPARP